MVSEQCKAQGIEQRDLRFSRKEIREVTSWGNTQLKVHCRRLEDMEYLLIHRGGRGQSFEYELLYSMEPQQNDKQLMGLIDVEKLTYDAKKAGQSKSKSGASRPQVGRVSERVKPVKLNGTNGLAQSGRTDYKQATLVL